MCIVGTLPSKPCKPCFKEPRVKMCSFDGTNMSPEYVDLVGMATDEIAMACQSNPSLIHRTRNYTLNSFGTWKTGFIEVRGGCTRSSGIPSVQEKVRKVEETLNVVDKTCVKSFGLAKVSKITRRRV